MEQPQSPEWNLETRRIVGVIAFIGAALLLIQFRSVLPLIFSAIVIAYLLNPIANFFQARLLNGRLRPLAVVLTFVLVISIIVLAMLFVVPTVIEEAQGFFTRMPNLLQTTQDRVIALLEDEITFEGTPLERFFSEPIIIADVLGVDIENINLNELFTGVGEEGATIDTISLLRPVTTSITGSAFLVVGGAFSTILRVVFLLTMMFYLMTDGENMVNAIVRAVPDGYHDDVRRLLRELGHVWNAYLRGQVTLSIIMGLAMYIMARILGIPGAIFLGIFAGIMEFIPNIGPATAMIPAAWIALFSQSSTIPVLSGWVFALVVIIVWTVLQQTEAAVLIPRIVGDSLNLHPFVVIVAVVSGVSVGGIFAVLVAAPVMASLRLIAQYTYGKLTNRDPFPNARKTVRMHQRERRPLLVRLGDICTRWVRDLMSSRAVTRR